MKLSHMKTFIPNVSIIQLFLNRHLSKTHNLRWVLLLSSWHFVTKFSVRLAPVLDRQLVLVLTITILELIVLLCYLQTPVSHASFSLFWLVVDYELHHCTWSVCFGWCLCILVLCLPQTRCK